MSESTKERVIKTLNSIIGEVKASSSKRKREVQSILDGLPFMVGIQYNDKVDEDLQLENIRLKVGEYYNITTAPHALAMTPEPCDVLLIRKSNITEEEFPIMQFPIGEPICRVANNLPCRS